MKQYMELRTLVAMSVNGDITPEQVERLKEILSNDAQAREVYRECLELYANLHCSHAQDVTESLQDKTQPRTFPKFKLLVACAAILLLVILFGWQQILHVQAVATVVDAIEVRADKSSLGKLGTRLRVGQGPFILEKGCLHLAFDQGVHTILEGPCRFDIRSEMSLHLLSGRVWAEVEPQANGFTVTTPFVEVVDLGTEFGVLAQETSTDVHVLKGTVELVHAQFKHQIPEGQAKRVHISDASPQDLDFDAQSFVRSINSKTGLVWRDVRTIDLADLASGGHGQGKGRPGYEIDPLSGKFQEIGSEPQDRLGDHRYHAVQAIPSIDGIFVPDGDYGAVVVSSEGHVFDDCPGTSNVFYCEFLSCSMIYKSMIAGKPRGLVLNGDAYGEGQQSALYMHANLGITYNLDVIRQFMPSGEGISHFQSLVGISEETNDPHVGDLDVWILLDGEVAYAKRNIRVRRPVQIRVPIESQDRFLSLVVTDSGKTHPGYIDTFADWCVFAEPQLVLDE